MAEKQRSNPLKFMREVRQEGSKVTWTGRQEVLVTTLFVLAFVVLAAIFLFFVDALAQRAICMALNLNVVDCLITGRAPGDQL